MSRWFGHPASVLYGAALGAAFGIEVDHWLTKYGTWPHWIIPLILVSVAIWLRNTRPIFHEKADALPPDEQKTLEDVREYNRMESWARGDADEVLLFALGAIGLPGFAILYWFGDLTAKSAMTYSAGGAFAVVFPIWGLWALNNWRRYGLPKSKKLREKIAALDLDLHLRGHGVIDRALAEVRRLNAR